MKAVVAAFNQEKALLVGAFSVIVQLHRLIVYSTNTNHAASCPVQTICCPLPSRIIALDISYLYHGILAGLGGSSIAALPKLDKMTRDNPCRGPGPGLGLT